jgi:hypothetical protein
MIETSRHHGWLGKGRQAVANRGGVNLLLSKESLPQEEWTK